MADAPDGHWISTRDWADFRKLLADYRGGRLTNRPPGEGLHGGRSTDVAAIANGSIAAGATGSFFLADSAFDATANERDAVNDSGVVIPNGTKCYLGRVRPLPGLRVKQAFVCTTPAGP